MAGLISFFGGRAFAWLILGGGGLLALTMLWQGAKHKGAVAEASKWTASIMAKTKEDRAANNSVNMGTIIEQGNLQETEASINARWKTAGRGAQAKAKE